jgi:hypothetical protein
LDHGAEAVTTSGSSLFSPGCSTAYDLVEHCARELFNRADPTGIWAAADYSIQAHFRKEAVRRLQQSARQVLIRDPV